jgi:hypothetical protein
MMTLSYDIQNELSLKPLLSAQYQKQQLEDSKLFEVSNTPFDGCFIQIDFHLNNITLNDAKGAQPSSLRTNNIKSPTILRPSRQQVYTDGFLS